VKNRTSLGLVRLFVWSFLSFIFCTLCSGLLMGAALVAIPGAGPQSGPKIWLAEPQTVAVNHLGSPSVVAPLVAGQAQPLAMISADVDGDGIADLLVGYSTPNGGAIAEYRGNLDAFAPQSDASFQAIGRGQFPSPFLPDAQAFAIPVRPDFVATGDFTGQGRLDLVVASRGGSTLYIFNGDGKGSFTPGPTISLTGGVTSLGTGFLGKSLPFTDLIVGVSSSKQSFLAVYAGSSQGLAPLSAFPLKAPATSINFGEFGDIGPDAAFLSGGQVVLLHSSSMQLETLSLPVSAQVMVLGSFVYDRIPGLQIALLDSSGSIAIAAHNEFDPRVFTVDEMRSIRQARRNGQPNPLIVQPFVATHGWKIIESVPSAATFSSGQPPVLLRTRISNQGADDVMAISPFTGQMSVVSHPDPVPGASTFIPAALSTRPYPGSPVAAISARVNVDGRPGVLALHQGEMAPRAMMPLPDPTFTVNRTDDPTPVSPITNACNGVANDCSLREALLKANGDTVMVPAGTYTLTIPKVANDCTGNFGALSAERSVTIVGAGQATTIIQAGVSQATGVDMVINVNEDLVTTNCPVTNASASLSNLTLQNGHNRGTHGIDGDGGCMEFDTGSSGNTTLNLTNVTLNNCTTTQGNGGGIAIFNFTHPGTGAVTVSNSIFSSNSANDSVSVGTGGAIWVSIGSRLGMSNSKVINNRATQISTDGNSAGSGGGITTTSNVTGSPLVAIHASTISGNQAAGLGGGLNVETNLLIDQDSVISNNSAGSAGKVNELSGGGIFADTTLDCSAPPCKGDAVTLTKVTITGNSAPNGSGGGIFTGSNSGAGGMTISFSRFAGNTAGTAGTANLNNNDTTITATNNWWGTNTPASTINNSNGGVTTFDPFIVLTNTPGSPKIKINTPTTLLGDMSKDNHGVGTTLAGNLDVLVGLPITFDAILGTIPQTQPETLGNPIPSAMATYNAGGVDGAGSADATVDQATVTASITVIGPPVITKAFGAASIPLNATTSLSFILTNPNATTALTGVAFSDTLPTGMVVSTPNGLTGACGSGTIIATAGSGVISLTGASLAASGSCTLSVNVTGSAAAQQNNTTGSVTSTEGGTGGTASASLVVVAPPSIAKTFNPVTIAPNGVTTLTFTITNPAANTGAEAGVAFTDTLPAGLVVSTPNGLMDNCGGTATATAGSGSISLTGGTVGVNTSCTVLVNVTGTATGVFTNTTGAVTSTNGGTGNTATAILTVASAPSITKQFGALTIPLNGTTTLTFNITNSNTNVTLTGVAFNDLFPAGIVVGPTPNGTNSCGGTFTSVTGVGSVSLTGGTLAPSASCTASVTVQGTVAGVKNNSVQVTSTGGTGNTSNATITVVAPPTINAALSITKTHQGTFRRGQNGAQYFLTVSDAANAGPTVGAVTVVDTLPAIGNSQNLQPVSLTGTGWTCDLPSLTCTRSDALAPGASYPVITFTVNIPQDITNSFTNTATASGGGDPNSHTASDPASLGPPIQITSTDSGTATVQAGMAATFNFMVDASGVNPPAAVVAFTCSGQPAGTACIFNPLAEGQIVRTMTMTVTTLGHATATAPPMGKYGPPIFAALLLPMMGLVGVGLRAGKIKNTRLRMALAFGGLMLLMALLGCGGSPQGIPTVTQRGTFTIIVTGTADTPQGTAQGSASVTLTVQ
jgi:FG-GAP-like repeat